MLHGVISMDGVGPDGIRIRELLARLNNDEVKEVIMATNPTVEGGGHGHVYFKAFKASRH